MEWLSVILEYASLDSLWHSLLTLFDSEIVPHILSASKPVFAVALMIFIFFPSFIDDFSFWPRKEELHESDPEILTFRPTKPRKVVLLEPEPILRDEVPVNKLSLGNLQIEQIRASHYKQDPNRQYCDWVCFSQLQPDQEAHYPEKHSVTLRIKSLPADKIDLSVFLQDFMTKGVYEIDSFFYDDTYLYEAHLVQTGEENCELKFVEKDFDADSYCPDTSVFRRTVEDSLLLSV